MRKLRAWFVRLGGFLGGKRRASQDFAQEMESHLQLHIDENQRQGMSAEEARRNALMKLGGVAQIEEILRDRRSLPALESFAQDFRFALRMLLKNPGFTITAVLILALGIGANTAMFSVVRAVLLRPLAYSQPDRIVTLASLWKRSGHKGQVSAPDFHDWHDQSTAFDHMAMYSNWDVPVTVGSGASTIAEYVSAAPISSEFFETLGTEPFVGRKFTDDELKVGSAGAAIVSDGFAIRSFSEPQLALGKAVVVDGKSLEIVGVVPLGFHFPEKTDVWLTSSVFGEETPSRGAHNYRVVGRLKEGVDLAEAQAQMTAIGARLEEKYPDSNKTKSVAVARHGERLSPYVAVDACRSRRRAGDRVRQPRQHAARSRRRPHQGDRDSRSNRRRPRANRATTRHRKYRARAGRRILRPNTRLLGRQITGGTRAAGRAATLRNRD
jgi:MacB-like periplasmic core domain